MIDDVDNEKIGMSEQNRKIVKSIAIGLGIGLVVFIAYLFYSGEIYTMRLL